MPSIIISNKNIDSIIFLKDLKLSFFDKKMLVKYKKIGIKSIKLPIHENDVIIPIVINRIKHLMYIFKKKFLSSFLS